MGYWLIISLLTGWICAWFAKNNGRNTTVWFIVGFFGSIIACFVAVLINKKIQAKKQNNAL